MPIFTRPDAEIHYEVHGAGHPLLLFAPGGLRSQLEFWRYSPSNPSAPPPWMNPMVDLASRFTVIGMDRRNAGKSRGAVTETHGWHTYAGDHLALMDHLGHRRFHVMGGCIGATYCLTLCELAPERITAAVLQNPIGLHETRAPGARGGKGFPQPMPAPAPPPPRGGNKKFGPNFFGGRFLFRGAPGFRPPPPPPAFAAARQQKAAPGRDQ